MNQEKLERLRNRYENAQGSDIDDASFAEAASLSFIEGDRRVWPFAGPPSFLGAPLLLNPSESDLRNLDVALVGVPMDLGVTNRAGARLGPRAVRSIERIGPYEPSLRMSPMAKLRVADIGDVPFRSRFSLEACHSDIEDYFREIVSADVIPLSIGGDHSISRAILSAVGEARPVGMIHIDAHCDTSGIYEGSKFHHGGPFRQAVLEGTLDPDRVIQIGIRGGAEYLWEFSFESGMTVIHADEFQQLGADAVISRAREIVGDGPTYVSFDVDSLDPGFAPGTGTPEVGGLQPREVLNLLRGIHGINFVGGDVVEVAPQYDSTTNTAHCAAQMLFQLLCLAVH